MKKFLILCCAVFLLSTGLVLASQTYVLKVKVQAANVRSEPDRNASVVKTLPLGTILESQNKLGEWFEIIIDDGKGTKLSAYINTSVVDIVSTGAAQPVQPPVQQVQPPVQPPVQAPPQPAPAPVYQQPVTYAAPKVYSKGGIRLLGGLTNSNISYDKSRSAEADKYIKSRMGPMGGIGFEIGSQFSFEIDLMYMPKGVKFQGTYDATAEGGSRVDFDVDIVANEISVPVLIKIKLLRGTTPFLFGGGEIGYILNGKTTYSFTSNGETQKGEEDLLKADANGENSINRIDYGAVFGGGFEINLGGLKFTIEGRYHMGLANLFKQTAANEGQGATSSDYVRTKALVVLAGIKF
jgi:hypothetical protein